MKILITGIGITGKSTFRRKLKNWFFRTGFRVRDIDGDYDEEKIPKKFKGETVYIIEDVHGLMGTEETCLPLNSYDLIFYLLPTFSFHLILWLKRIWRWFQKGEGSWDKKRPGWLGSGKRYDPSNLPIFFRQLIRDFLNRRKWIAQDKKVLSQFENDLIIIQPKWKIGGTKFNLTHFNRL